MIFNLNSHNFPEDLNNMNIDELKQLAPDIREFLINKVSKTGGHLASNLGVVEITIAMHKVFNSPRDKIIWDVGHQSYVHKLLTGRMGQFDTLRQFGGMSGFPKRCESPHDVFETGHSTTSLSAAFGIAKARDLKNEDFNVLAVIGDGALTGGMAYEALNNIGASKTKMIIVLNDNGMSIGKNIGSVSTHLTTLRTSKGYLDTKSFIKRSFNKSLIGKSITSGLTNFKNNLKYSLIERGGVLFEELGITYLGPIDGHNIEQLIDCMEKAKKLNEPVLIHAITQKGKGYSFAENEPNKFHGIGPFDIGSGQVLKNNNDKKTYSTVMGEGLTQIAKKRDNIVAISAAMCEATGLSIFQKEFPNRFFDVGIAEQHAVTFAAGLATQGLHPLVAIYSSFLQRSYDQILMDVCMQNLPMVFAIDRAGNVGADGATHHGMFDIAYLSSMPNMTVLTPKDGNQLVADLSYAFTLESPVAIRYPRGVCQYSYTEKYEFSGTNRIPSGSFDVCLLGVGKMFNTAEIAYEKLKERGIVTSLIDIEIIQPMHLKENNNYSKIYVTIEDGQVHGGFGQIFASAMVNEDAKVLNFGWPKEFIGQGTFDELAQKYGLDADSIVERIVDCFEGKA